MKLEWNEAKNRINIRKHGLDFADAEEVLKGVIIATPDTREAYGERRWQGIGAIGQRIVQIVFAEAGADTIRIMSLRKATSRERKEYEKAIQNGLEAH